MTRAIRCFQFHRYSPLERAYLDKYGSGYPGDSALFSVHPRVVFGFVEREEELCGAATRWSFEDAD